MYTDKEIKKLAAGIFKRSPKLQKIYSNGTGSFLNENQFDVKSKRKDFNPKEWDEITRNEIDNPPAPKVGKTKPEGGDGDEGKKKKTAEGDDEGKKKAAAKTAPKE